MDFPCRKNWRDSVNCSAGFYPFGIVTKTLHYLSPSGVMSIIGAGRDTLTG